MTNTSGGSRFDGFEAYVTNPAGDTLEWSWNSQVGVDSRQLPVTRFGYHGNGFDLYTYTDGTERAYVSLCYVDYILACNNGQDDRDWSRIVEYALDESTMTATLVWDWREDGWYADWLGDVHWLAGDRVWVTQGEQDGARCPDAAAAYAEVAGIFE